MNGLLSSFIASFKASSSRRERFTKNRRRRTMLNVEGMEGRQLMTAMLTLDAPKTAPAAQVQASSTSNTVINGSLTGTTIGYLNQAATANTGNNVWQISETSTFPTTFPYYVSIGSETVKVNGYSGTINLNNVLAGNYPLSVQRDFTDHGAQAHSAGTPIVFLSENPPLTGTVGNPPSAPGGLSAQAVSSSQINITWLGESGVTGYVLYRRNGSSTFAQIDTTTGTSFSDKSLQAGTTYYYTIAAFNNNGTGVESPYVSATTSAAPAGPAIPTTGPFGAAYNAVPNAAATLGQPTSGVLNGSGGATYIQFQNGQIILPPGSGTAYSIYGAIYKAYAPAFAALGQPQSSIQGGAGGASYIQFQNGQIILPPSSGTAYVLDGAIYQAYAPAFAALGQPQSGIQGGSGGSSYVQFQNGQVILPPGSSTAYVLDGAIYAAYAKNSAWVTMGQPVSGQYSYNGGLRINFQHGYIAWTAASGAKIYNS